MLQSRLRRIDFRFYHVSGHAFPWILGGSAKHDSAIAVFVYVLSVLAILWTAQLGLGQESDSNAALPPGVTILDGGTQTSEIETTTSQSVSCIPCTKHETVESEIFEISTRHLPDRFRCINFDQPNVEVNRWIGGRWVRSAIDDALPMETTGIQTILYVHGNFMERNNALERVRIVDRYIKERAVRPYRLLMLSWPSQPEKKPLRDVFDNAESAESQSLYVAWILRRLRHEQNTSILGFSFGARSVTGGLHLDAGGSIPGFVSPPPIVDDVVPTYRLALVAPAVDRNWIEPNGRHRQALDHVDFMVNLYNSRDPVLRRFRFLDRIARPIAAGFAGFESFTDPRATTPLAGGTPRIRQFDCGGVIGTTHAEKSYYGECPYFRSMVIKHLLWQDIEGSQSNACIVP